MISAAKCGPQQRTVAERIIDQWAKRRRHNGHRSPAGARNAATNIYLTTSWVAENRRTATFLGCPWRRRRDAIVAKSCNLAAIAGDVSDFSAGFGRSDSGETFDQIRPISAVGVLGLFTAESNENTSRLSWLDWLDAVRLWRWTSDCLVAKSCNVAQRKCNQTVEQRARMLSIWNYLACFLSFPMHRLHTVLLRNVRAARQSNPAL